MTRMVPPPHVHTTGVIKCTRHMPRDTHYASLLSPGQALPRMPMTRMVPRLEKNSCFWAASPALKMTGGSRYTCAIANQPGLGGRREGVQVLNGTWQGRAGTPVHAGNQGQGNGWLRGKGQDVVGAAVDR